MTYPENFQKKQCPATRTTVSLLEHHFPPTILTYTHSSKHDGKVFFTVVHHIFGFLHQASLATYLSCNLKEKAY